ncbi:MAG TPA: hypothetical protein VMT71_00270 [Syntrophorhabdales bacterium]|nr:hypothetical protein [Syntrophorhabdales bacterium]
MKKCAVLILAVLLLAGCASTWNKITGQEDKQSMPKNEAPNVTYYSFPDIPIPTELELVRDKSFVYETSNLKTGVLVLKGNLDINSLEQYFKTNMAKNNWKFMNGFKYATVILNYTKDDKAAHIRISRETWSTYVEVWVGPLDKPMMMSPTTERK